MSERARKRDAVKVIADMCGVQAQLLAAAELALWARIQGVKQGDMQELLFKEKSAFRTWSMRGTLHLLPSFEFRTYIGALKTREGYRNGAWLRYFGVTLEEIDSITKAIGEALGTIPLTRKELAERIFKGERLRPGETPVGNRRMTVGTHRILSSWGEFLKPAAYNGLLACGPNRDGEATFVRADRFLGTKIGPDSAESMKEMVRKYLSCYGPATHDDFARWWGTQPAPAKRLFKSMEDELVPVDVEGYNGWITKADCDALWSVTQDSQVRLLPNFDSYVIGFRPRDLLVRGDAASLVFRPQGWISPVLLVDGRIVGTWERSARNGNNGLKIRLFERLTSSHKEALRDEIRAMSDYFGSDVAAAFERG